MEGSKISNCYNFGKIIGKKISGIAWGNSEKIKIISCYNSGFLEGITKYGITYKGIAKNCYYLTNCGTTSENSTEVSNEQLKEMASTLDRTYTIDDENNIITINENTFQNVWKEDSDNKNQGYPILDF